MLKTVLKLNHYMYMLLGSHLSILCTDKHLSPQKVNMLECLF